MKQKKFGDYLDPFMPLSIQFIYGANVFAILKIAGELQKLDWTFIFIMYGIGIAMRFIKAAIKQATDEIDVASAGKNINA